VLLKSSGRYSHVARCHYLVQAPGPLNSGVSGPLVVSGPVRRDLAFWACRQTAEGSLSTVRTHAAEACRLLFG